MNPFGVLVYAAAAGVYIVFRRQFAAHRRELEREYARLGLPSPPVKPKIEMLEAVLTVMIGFLISIASAAAIVSFYQTRGIIDLDGGQWLLLALSLAGGFALEVLGIRSIRENYRHRVKNPRRDGMPPARGPSAQ